MHSCSLQAANQNKITMASLGQLNAQLFVIYDFLSHIS
jgi:hypothetical protein